VPPSEADIREYCITVLTASLGIPEDRIEPETTFARLGLDSASSVYLIVALEEWLGVELTPELTFDHPTLARLARHLAGRPAASEDGGSI